MNITYNCNPDDKPTILIVEDHDVLRENLGDFLKMNFEDYLILEAKNGEEAIVIAHDNKPHIILMDIVLPGINGIEATRRIKANLPQTPVVMLTIHECSEYRADAEAAGASAYILKRKMGNELIPVLTDLLSHWTDAGEKNWGIEELRDLRI